MRLIRDFDAIPKECHGAALALGNFDGVHRGHQAILRQCLEIARKGNIPAAVMTFEPHPREFFGRGGDKLRLYSFRDKAKMLRDLDINVLFVARFNRAFASLSAGEFVEELLQRQLGVRHVVTGYNFAFGKGRQGNVDFLAAESRRLGFGFTACPPVQDGDGETVSSSAIRRHLAAGEVKKAAALLGRPYAIGARVRRGQQRGREMGFPTANLKLDHLFRPRFGIYAVRVAAGGEAYDGVASLGINPTFDLKEPVLEAHIFDKTIDLYGKRIHVELIDFLRDERKFDTMEALRLQMEEDAKNAKSLLAHAR
ncbi:MAG: bifunctional riboflavin kinase/FAD synthetase [Pseudomonadota bacterium]|nr:bifunctional riboflavin kinase/FAD synthetase [Pseudomonadota bacterium]